MNAKGFIHNALRILFGITVGFGIVFLLYNLQEEPPQGVRGFGMLFLSAFVPGAIIQKRGWLIGLVLWGSWNVFTLVILGFMGMRMHQISFWSAVVDFFEFIYNNDLLQEFIWDTLFALAGAILGGITGISVTKRIKTSRTIPG